MNHIVESVASDMTIVSKRSVQWITRFIPLGLQAKQKDRSTGQHDSNLCYPSGQIEVLSPRSRPIECTLLCCMNKMCCMKYRNASSQ